METYCSFSDSYGVGKGIGMHARLASISRAFRTTHYQSLDGKIRQCLEKWLRIDGKLYYLVLGSLVDGREQLKFYKFMFTGIGFS